MISRLHCAYNVLQYGPSWIKPNAIRRMREPAPRIAKKSDTIRINSNTASCAGKDLLNVMATKSFVLADVVAGAKKNTS